MVSASRRIEPWDRQPGEGAKAFEAFTKYRDAGPTRTSQKVAEECAKSHTLIRRWSSRYAWVERCAEWDRHVDRERQKKRKVQISTMLDRHMNMARAVQNQIFAKLQTMIDKETGKATGDVPSGQIAAWMESAVKVERLALGISTDKVAEGDDDPNQPNESPIDYSKLTASELRELDRLLAKASGRAQPGKG